MSEQSKMLHLNLQNGFQEPDVQDSKLLADKSFSFGLSVLYAFQYTKITEVNLSVFVYRLFHEDFSPILGTNYRSFQSFYF